MTLSAHADTIAQWNFNSNPPDPTNSFTTGSLDPFLGIGTAALVGGATSIFASGTGSSDPVTIDDTGWNTSTYPSQGTSNKMRGVQFNVSTLGFESIVVTWDQRNSASSSRYARFQYSADGTTFVDGVVISATSVDTFTPMTANLNSILPVNNNANFAFRIVTEFESTATEAGADQYVPTGGGSYAVNGTVRYDMVTISGTPVSGNMFPTITAISNQVIRANTSTEALPFTIGDAETPADQLTLSATSSNPNLIGQSGITFGGSGPDRTVQLTPGIDQTGTTTITIFVADDGGKSNSTSFVLTVVPTNTPPTISDFTNYHTVVNVPLAPINFHIGDAESTPGDLTITRASSNQAIVPDANIVFGGNGSNRTVTITPVANQSGNAAITITVDDGTFSVSRRFSVMVVPSANVLLCESFTYADGSVTTNSGFLWSTQSGIPGQMQVVGEVLQLTGISSQTEDVSAVLIGAPHATNSGKALYGSLTVNFSELPGREYFAHYRDVSGDFRARIFGTSSNATAGFFRMGIANTLPAANGVVLARDLSLNTDYLAVTRYDLDTGVSSLWVDPASEEDIGVTATDTASPSAINSFAFRQSNANGGIGDLRVDNLKVGCAFSDVLPGVRLRIISALNEIQVSWPEASSEGYILQSTESLSPSSWNTVSEEPTVSDGKKTVRFLDVTGSQFFRLIKP